jgi:hypothetical protein
MGAAERARGWWIRQRAKQRRGDRRFGAWKEQTHKRIERKKGGRRAARAAAGQGFRPLLKDKRTGVLAACVETPVLAQAGEIGRGDKGSRRTQQEPRKREGSVWATGTDCHRSPREDSPRRHPGEKPGAQGNERGA